MGESVTADVDIGAKNSDFDLTNFSVYLWHR
jgi:hypothetical protein